MGIMRNMEKDTPSSGAGLVVRAAAVIAFLVTWLALLSLMLRSIEKIWSAMTVGDTASLAAGCLLIPMTVFLIQSVIHLPRGHRNKAVFLRPYSLTRFSVLIFPAFMRLEAGPVLEIITTAVDREAIVAGLERNMRRGAGMVPRLALLLDNRSPIEIILRRLMNSRAKPVFLIGWLFFLVVGPARQFTRLWGYVFTRLWNDPGPENELITYKRKVAFDLVGRGKAFGADDLPRDEAKTLLARIWKELKRVYNNPFYGQDMGGALADLPDDPASGGPDDPVAAAFRAPWLAPRYYGIYLDLSVTLAARTAMELYDGGRDEDVSVFYPPELGGEVESTALLIAVRARLKSTLNERAEEGIVNLGGRPIPTWRINAWLFDIENDLDYHKQRIAAHHRRCRTSHLTRARRLQKGWPEYLEGALGVLHFAEHARRALNAAEANFERILSRPDKFSGEGLAEAARLHDLMADLHDRLIRLELTDELEVRPQDMLPLSLPAPTADAHRWLLGWGEVHSQMIAMLTDLRAKSLTALLWGEDMVAGRAGAAESDLKEAPPAPGLIPDFVFVRPPVEWPERVYSLSERLKTGFGHSFLAALVLALLLWQSQTLGRSSLVIYNGFGRDVTVWVDDKETTVRPYGRSLIKLQPGQVYDILTTTGGLPRDRFTHSALDESAPNSVMIRSHLIEHFSRRLEPVPTTEVYNIAGAAPLMLWWSPRTPDDGAAASEEFLGRPQWLKTDADILFRAPSSKDAAPARVLSGYGELLPSEMLSAFPDERDKGELIYLHALWDDPGTSGFWQWQSMAVGRVQAEILIQRLAREPDFLDRCVEQLGLLGIQ